MRMTVIVCVIVAVGAYRRMRVQMGRAVLVTCLVVISHVVVISHGVRSSPRRGESSRTQHINIFMTANMLR